MIGAGSSKMIDTAAVAGVYAILVVTACISCIVSSVDPSTIVPTSEDKLGLGVLNVTALFEDVTKLSSTDSTSLYDDGITRDVISRTDAVAPTSANLHAAATEGVPLGQDPTLLPEDNTEIRTSSAGTRSAAFTNLAAESGNVTDKDPTRPMTPLSSYHERTSLHGNDDDIGQRKMTTPTMFRADTAAKPDGTVSGGTTSGFAVSKTQRTTISIHLTSQDKDDDVAGQKDGAKLQRSTESTVSHAALWITVAFVVVLLLYITILIIYNARRRDWHQSLPPYSQFLEESTPPDTEARNVIDNMLRRISTRNDTDECYSLMF